MQAVVQPRYGGADSVALEEIDHPEVGDNAVLVDLVRSLGADEVIDYTRGGRS